MPDIVHPREPGLERIEAADRLVFLAFERDFADGFLARLGERDWGAFVASRLVLPVAGRPARCARSAARSGCVLVGEEIPACRAMPRAIERIDLFRKRE